MSKRLFWAVALALTFGRTRAAPTQSGVGNTLSLELLSESVQAALDKVSQTTPSEAFKEDSVRIALENPSLSFVQKRFIVNHLKSSTQNFEASHLPANLIEGLTTNDLMNIEVKPENAELLDKVGARLPYMLPSQQHGVFLSFMRSDSLSNTLDTKNLRNIITYLGKHPTSVGILFQYVSVKAFAELKVEFGRYYLTQDLPGSIQLHSTLPWSLRRMLWGNEFEPPLPIRLTTLSCADLKDKSFETVTDLLQEYNIIRLHQPSLLFPMSLIICFQEVIIKELKKRANASSGYLNYLQKEEIPRFGGVVLASMPLEEMDKIEEDAKALIFASTIGSVPPIDIVTTMPKEKAERLADFAFSRLFTPAESLNLDHVDVLGSLLLFSKGIVPKLRENVVEYYISSYPFGGNFRKIACLDEQSRMEWKEALLPLLRSDWGHVRMAQAGDLLVALNETDWDSIHTGFLYVSFPLLLAENNFADHLLEAPYHTNETQIMKICASWTKSNDIVTAVSKRNNFLLRVAEFRKNAQEADVAVPGEEEDSEESEPARRKRQALDDTLAKREEIAVRTVMLSRQLQSMKSTRSNAVKMHVAMNRLRALARLEMNRLLPIQSHIPHEADIAKHLKKYMPSNATIFSEVVRIDEDHHIQKTKALAKIISLTHLHVGEPKDTFCKFFKEICQDPTYDYQVLTFNPQDPYPNKPIEMSTLNDTSFPDDFSCSALRESGSLSSTLSASSLKQWPHDDFIDCSDILGSLDLESDEQQEILDTMKELQISYVTSDINSPEAQITLNRLMGPLVNQSTTTPKFNLKDIGPVSIVGQLPLSDEAIVRVGGDLGKDDLFKTTDSFQRLLLGSMGNTLCGVDSKTLEDAMNSTSNVVKEFMLVSFGQIRRCPNPETLTVMANEALNLYGNVSSWTPSLIRSLGPIVGGLATNDASHLDLGDVSRVGLRHLTSDVISSIPEEKLVNIKQEVLPSISDKMEQIDSKSMDMLMESAKKVPDSDFYKGWKRSAPNNPNIQESKESSAQPHRFNFSVILSAFLALTCFTGLCSI